MSKSSQTTTDDHNVLRGIHPARLNHDGAMEIPEFVPLRQELEELVRHWRGVQVRDLWTKFLFGKAFGSQSGIVAFGGDRMEKIAQIIGTEQVAELASEVDEDFRAKQDPRLLAIYFRGKKEHHERVQRAINDLEVCPEDFRKVVDGTYRDLK